MVNKDWLDIAVLEDYLDGRLDAKTMNRIEREALEDPFVAEALAGLSESPKRSLNSISILQRQLQERIVEQQSSKKRTIITWQRLSIAAAAAVMFIAVSVVFWMREDNRRKQLAALPKKVEVTIAQNTPPVASTIVPEVAADKSAAVALSPVAKDNSYARLKTKKQVDVAAMPAQAPVLNEVAVPALAGKKVDESIAVSTTSTVKVPADSTLIIAGKGGQVGNPVFLEPVGGMANFEDYIKERSRFRNENVGRPVILSFTVNKKGKPENIKVLSGIAKKYDQEAIRLLSKGPKWPQATTKDPALTVIIKF